jgi:beta-galactosidase
MGCNAIRAAHGPFAPVFCELCDELGLIVMDEAFDGWEKNKAQDDYGNYFNEWCRHDPSSLILRDRNHPAYYSGASIPRAA